MKKWHVVGLIVLALLTLIIGIALILEVKYAALLPSPRVSHDTVASGRTVFRAQMEPRYAQGYLAKRFATVLGLPPWVLPRVLPREVVLLSDPDLTNASAAVTVFVNDQRLGPIIAQTINDSGVLTAHGPFSWSAAGMVRKSRGVLLLEGAIPIQRGIVDLVRQHWGVVVPLSPLELEGGHLLEAVLDLRDGRGFALVAELVGRNAPPTGPAHPTQLVSVLGKIVVVHAFVDLAADNQLALQFRVECRPEVRDADVEFIKLLIDSAYKTFRADLDDRFRVQLAGGSEIDGVNILGFYTLTNFEPLLTAAGLVF